MNVRQSTKARMQKYIHSLCSKFYWTCFDSWYCRYSRKQGWWSLLLWNVSCGRGKRQIKITVCTPLGDIWMSWDTQSTSTRLGRMWQPIQSPDTEVVIRLSKRMEYNKDSWKKQAQKKRYHRGFCKLYAICYGWSKAMETVGNIERLDRCDISPT